MKTELLALIDELVKYERYVTKGKFSAAKDAKRVRADIVFLLTRSGPKLDRETLVDLIAEQLSGTYHCTRVWNAWNVGTMSQDDFEAVDESDTPGEIADSIIAKFEADPAQYVTPAEYPPLPRPAWNAKTIRATEEAFSADQMRTYYGQGRIGRAPAPAAKCETCNDNGLIGGPSFYDPGEGGVPCPDCSAPAAVEPVAYLHDDGYWTAAKTEQGRVLSDRLHFAGSPKIGVHLHPAPAPNALDAETPFLQETDQHLLHRFIETSEDDESYDISKDDVKRLANLGVLESCGFGRYGVTMFGYWAHERFWHQHPSLPLKTNTDRDLEKRAAIAAQTAQGAKP